MKNFFFFFHALTSNVDVGPQKRSNHHKSIIKVFPHMMMAQEGLFYYRKESSALISVQKSQKAFICIMAITIETFKMTKTLYTDAPFSFHQSVSRLLLWWFWWFWILFVTIYCQCMQKTDQDNQKILRSTSESQSYIRVRNNFRLWVNYTFMMYL